MTFVGRLATYRYYNMDQIVGQALATFRRMDEKRAASGRSRLRSPPSKGQRVRALDSPAFGIARAGHMG